MSFQPVPIRRNLRFFLIFPLLFALMLLCASIRWIDGSGPYDNSANVADLDGDGDPDVLLNNLRHETEIIVWAGTTLWYNQGGGQFTPVEVYNLLDQRAPAFAAGADVDRDGDTDLVGVFNDQLGLVLNQNGRYQSHNGTFPPGYHSQFRSVTLGDLNGDGQVDGFVAGCCGMLFPAENNKTSYDAPSSFVWLNDWNPRGWMDFHALPLPALDNLPIHGAALGDLDGDGDLDLFAAVQSPPAGHAVTPGSRILLNDGAGNLADTGLRLGDDPGYAVALGDLDADGDLDALTSVSTGAQIWLNPGNAAFSTPTANLSGPETRAVFLSDLDGDRDLDAVLAGKNEARLWFNDGQAHFYRATQRIRYTERHALAVADFNADGAPDLFAPVYAETYTLWLNDGRGVFLPQSH